ncbi:ArgS-related anticodon-binding protein NrtL [Streptomyces sp. NPDC006638]|uniref:ArgS-related anticodon-binding protein NrtL n=1 Tax=Streptomyces sp. NPDC006638 TaxID=3157183 RepID=UPI0033B8D059
MTPADLSTTVLRAVRRAVEDGALRVTVPDRVTVERPRPGGSGDYATNAALRLAADAGLAPREVAEILRTRVATAEGIARIDITGPGFLNFTLTEDDGEDLARTVLSAGPRYGHGNALTGTTVVFAPAREPRARVWTETVVALLQCQGATASIAPADTGPDAPAAAGRLAAPAAPGPDVSVGFGPGVPTTPRRRTAPAAPRPGAALAPADPGPDATFGPGTAPAPAAPGPDVSVGLGPEVPTTPCRRTAPAAPRPGAALAPAGPGPDATFGPGAVPAPAAPGPRAALAPAGPRPGGAVTNPTVAPAAPAPVPETLQVVPVPDGNDLFGRLGADAARWALLRAAAHDRPAAGTAADALLVQRESNPLFRVRYAYARTRALSRAAERLGFGSGGVEGVAVGEGGRPHPTHVALTRLLRDHPAVLEAAARHRAPDRLARGLEQVADAVLRFQESGRPLPLGDEKPSAAHRSRIALAEAAGAVLAGGLSLLGIDAPEFL